MPQWEAFDSGYSGDGEKNKSPVVFTTTRPQVHQDQMRWQSDHGHFRTAHVEIFEMAVGLMILMAGGDEKTAMHQQYIHSLP